MRCIRLSMVFILYTTKNIIRATIFLYSPCPNLEGIKDAFSYKFRRLTIGQNCVPCAQTRLPRPRGHRDAFSSSSERRKCRAFQQACLAGHRASSEARGDVCSLSWSGDRFDIRAEWELRHYTVSLIIYSWPPVRGVVFICACALYQLALYSMLFNSSVQSHYPMIVTSNILVDNDSRMFLDAQEAKKVSEHTVDRWIYLGREF